MSIDWKNTADDDGYVVIREKQKRKIFRLSVLDSESNESIYSLLFEEIKRKDTDSDE
ncbi:hypothetical protein H6B11_16745 [Mediterraneibacter glycyrrhizinilyticus]|nr:hypothetical protein [Mediterraneibacter glycyrrhizinilyticus]MBM6855762.1 hypothetical protein [Mediterraneibacter glycyrrhizinilyticus]